MAEDNIPQAYLNSLKAEEGSISRIYKDTNNIPTAGVGHTFRATDEEQKEYKSLGVAGWAKETIDNIEYEVAVDDKGKIIKLDDTKINSWLKEDAKESYTQAKKQSKQLGIDNEAFTGRLGHVIYQQGPDWKNKFSGSWDALKKGRYEDAIKNIEWKNPADTTQGKSKWYKETPERAKKFMEGIKSLKPEDTSSIDMVDEVMAVASKDDIFKIEDIELRR